MRERGTEIGREEKTQRYKSMCYFFRVPPTLFGICRHLNTLLNIISRLRLYFALLFSYKHSCRFWKIEQFWCATFYASHLYHGKYIVLLTFDCVVEYFFFAPLYLLFIYVICFVGNFQQILLFFPFDSLFFVCLWNK